VRHLEQYLTPFIGHLDEYGEVKDGNLGNLHLI
jgi:hypothetical protein